MGLHIQGVKFANNIKKPLAPTNIHSGYGKYTFGVLVDTVIGSGVSKLIVDSVDLSSNTFLDMLVGSMALNPGTPYSPSIFVQTGMKRSSRQTRTLRKAKQPPKRQLIN